MTGPHAGDADVIVIGAGIVGLATARALLETAPATRIVVLDKEGVVAAHQSGHNSGVVHAGVYYPPGSAKARLCTTGREELLGWCTALGIDHDVCGKVVVATSTVELDRLRVLHERSVANGLDVSLVDRRGLQTLEPFADGVAALHVRATAVVDFAEVTRRLAAELVAHGGVELVLGEAVTGVHEHATGVEVETTGGRLRATWLVNCAGLGSDLVARMAGLSPEARIVAFRGEYHELVPARRHLVRSLIYPVPDPRFPFLGVHLTRGIGGSVHVGPNAVLALDREGYRWSDVDRGEIGSLLRSPGLRSLARRYWRTGSAEVLRSWSRRRLAHSVRRLVPDVRADDLVPAGSGVRAQAVTPDGRLVDDFSFATTARAVHVLNAPSPAATASFAIGREVVAHLTALGAP